MKSNLSGEFTVVNPYLIEELKKEGLWDDVMLSDLKYYEGSLSQIKEYLNTLKKNLKQHLKLNQDLSLNLQVEDKNG